MHTVVYYNNTKLNWDLLFTAKVQTKCPKTIAMCKLPQTLLAFHRWVHSLLEPWLFPCPLIYPQISLHFSNQKLLKEGTLLVLELSLVKNSQASSSNYVRRHWKRNVVPLDKLLVAIETRLGQNGEQGERCPRLSQKTPDNGIIWELNGTVDIRETRWIFKRSRDSCFFVFRVV